MPCAKCLWYNELCAGDVSWCELCLYLFSAAAPPQGSADFQVCRIADFQAG